MIKPKAPKKLSNGRYVCPKCGLSHAWEAQAAACCGTLVFEQAHPQTVYVELMTDPVNSPAHYTDGGIETIDFIEAKLNPEQFTGYCLGNALKYLSRSGKKDTGDTDLRKARWYINRALGDPNPTS